MNPIHELIDSYLSEKISANDFCDSFYRLYDLEINSPDITFKEDKLFSELSDMIGRFSNSKIDLKNFPNVYINEKDLKNKTIDIRITLRNIWNSTSDGYNHSNKEEE